MCKMSTCSLIECTYVMCDSKMGAPELVQDARSQPCHNEFIKLPTCIQTLPSKSIAAFDHPRPAMETAELPDLQLLVHCFSWCCCRSEIFSADHIKVKTLNSPVEPGQAIALSYGIGDFGREKHLFGHVDRPEPEPELVDGLEPEPALVRLEFGGEWEIQGLMYALVTLSEKHGAIWFDQLSIPQDPASITIHLRNMPRIYREFEVIVLLPNAPCPCLADAFDSWESNGLYTEDYLDGDFDLDAVATDCPNALPVSSYHFRLWTKQEFSYARVISIFHCGPPAKCYIDAVEWPNPGTMDLPLWCFGHLSRWGSWKYASYIGTTSNKSEVTKFMGWQTFFTAHKDGEQNMRSVVRGFLMRKACNAIETDQVKRDVNANTARFLLGAKLQRVWNQFEDNFAPADMESGHVVTIQRDFALAVLPGMRGYRLPQGHADMTLPELVDDGIDQVQEYMGGCFITTLPRGLFEEGIRSMCPKPSFYLRTEYIERLRDVYGSLSPTMFPYIHSPRLPCETLLHLRDVPRNSARLPQSNTYGEFFGSASTAEVCDFMRRIPAIDSVHTSSRIKAHWIWALAVNCARFPAPVNSWSSPVHEQAIFEASILDGRSWGPGSWPEVNHESACYNIICDHLRIHPEVAREKGLGLIVKFSDPPCIGLVNSVIYDKIRRIEECQRRHGSSAAELLRKDSGLCPEDWLTITFHQMTDERHLTLEATISNTLPHGIEHIRTLNPRYKESVPMYTVRGVWYECLGDDPCIGAELTWSYEDEVDHGAILI
jgi:hypothetical protein